MMICPKCEGCIRHGDRVRASIVGQFHRENLVGHEILPPFHEEWVEHFYCKPDPWWVKLSRWIRRTIKI